MALVVVLSQLNSCVLRKPVIHRSASQGPELQTNPQTRSHFEYGGGRQSASPGFQDNPFLTRLPMGHWFLPSLPSFPTPTHSPHHSTKKSGATSLKVAAWCNELQAELELAQLTDSQLTRGYALGGRWRSADYLAGSLPENQLMVPQARDWPGKSAAPISKVGSSVQERRSSSPGAPRGGENRTCLTHTIGFCRFHTHTRARSAVPLQAATRTRRRPEEHPPIPMPPVCPTHLSNLTLERKREDGGNMRDWVCLKNAVSKEMNINWQVILRQMCLKACASPINTTSQQDGDGGGSIMSFQPVTGRSMEGELMTRHTSQ